YFKLSEESYLDQEHPPSKQYTTEQKHFFKSSFPKIRTGTARCSPHRKPLRLLVPSEIFAVTKPAENNCYFNTKSINCCDNIIYRSGNTLRFPRVTREPPRTIVLWGLTLATIPAGVFVYFLRWICAFQLHHIYLSPD